MATALIVKRICSLPLRGLQCFINSVFRLANASLVCPHYTCISRRAKDVEVNFKTSTRGAIQHLAIDATGLKVYSEGEWKVKKHGTDGKRRVWRKLHIAVDTDTHEIIVAELTLLGVTDAEVLPNLLKQTRRVIKAISGAALWIKGASTQSGGWLPETLWTKQKMETEVWLPQAFTVRNRYVSCETVTWSNNHSW